MPRYCIVIPCNNNEDVIGEAVRSALECRHRDFAVAVTDNGSHDRSAAVIDAFDDPRLRKNLHIDAVPKTDNWNRTYRDVPDSDYLVTLHGDDRLHPDALAILDQATARRPALVHGAISLIEWNGTSIARRGFGLSYAASPSAFRWLQLVSNLVGVAGATIRADLFDRIGGWDPAWTYMQDTEMWWRLAEFGPVHHSGRPLGDYRLPGPRLNNPAFDAEYCAWYGQRRQEATSVVDRATIDGTLAAFDEKVSAAQEQRPEQLTARTRSWRNAQRAVRLGLAAQFQLGRG